MHLSSEAGEGLHVEGRVATGRGVFVLVCTSDCYSFLNLQLFRMFAQGGAPDTMGTALHAVGASAELLIWLFTELLTKAVLRGDADLIRLLCSRNELRPYHLLEETV